MLDIIKELQDTPIPLIFIAAGIAFLFLALSGGISGKIQIPVDRQKWAGTLGAILLLLGTALAVPRMLQESQSEKGKPEQVDNGGKSSQFKAERDRIKQEEERLKAEREKLAQDEERRRRDEQALEHKRLQDERDRLEQEKERLRREEQERLQADRDRLEQEKERLSREEREREQARLEQERREAAEQQAVEQQGHVGIDLFVSEFELDPEVPIQRKPVKVRIGIYNRGSQAAGSFTVQWWAGKNFPKPEHEWRIDRLSAKGGRILTHTYRGYRSWYGSLTTKVVIDPAGRIKDANREDNVFETNIRVKKQ